MFGRATVGATRELVTRANGSKLVNETKATIEEIKRTRDTCRASGSGPCMSKLTIGPDNLQFIDDVQVDFILLGHRPVLQIVDLGTHLFGMSFLYCRLPRKSGRCYNPCGTSCTLSHPTCYMFTRARIMYLEKCAGIAKQLEINCARFSSSHPAPLEP